MDTRQYDHAPAPLIASADPVLTAMHQHTYQQALALGQLTAAAIQQAVTGCAGPMPEKKEQQ